MTRIIALKETTDPAAVADQVILYSKDSGGITKFYVRQSDGTIIELSGTGSGEISAANVLTFKPGGADVGPVVFNTWSALYTKLDTLRTAAGTSGRYKIIFDDSSTTPPVLIPTGSWNMLYTEWEGVRSITTFNPVSVSVAEGANITNLLRITGMSVAKANTTGTPPISLTNQILDLNAATLVGGNIADTHIAQANGTSIIRTGDRAFLSNGGGSSDGAVLIAASATLALFMDGGAGGAFDAAIKGDGTTTLTLYVTNSSTQYGDQSSTFTGALTVQQFPAAWYWGLGDPNGVVSADQGKLIIDTASGTIWKNTDSNTAWSTLSSGGGDLGWYGTGPQGDETTDGGGAGDDTWLEDQFFHNYTITAGDTVRTGGNRLYCSGTLTIEETAFLDNSGSDGSVPTGGAGAPTGTLIGGTDGGKGGENDGPAATAAADNAYWPSKEGTPSGGSGGGGGGQPGGSSRPQFGFGAYMIESIATGNGTGGGSGGGGGEAGGGDGGGGGGGGGVMVVCARHIVAFPGSIRQRGGAGASAGSGGGGGGGTGGVIFVVTDDATAPTVDVVGGALGTGTSGDGTAGSDGVLIAISPIYGPL